MTTERSSASGDGGGGPARPASPRPERHTFRYPTHHLLAVVDRPEDARAVATIATRAGVPFGEVHVVAGEDADARMDLLGKDSRAQRVLFAVRFIAADQEPDFALYLAALRDGRAVVAVHVKDSALRARVVEGLRGSSAHFINFYGRLATEEITPWRGRELPLPGWLKR